MPTSSSRRRHRYSRRRDHCSGPLDTLFYLMAACSTMIDDYPSEKYDSEEDETVVTEVSSRSSERDRRKRRSHSSSRKSSSHSSRSHRQEPRSRSHSVRPDHRSRSLERAASEKTRSRSFSRSHRPSSASPLPPVQIREYTEIQVRHEEDDVSAISAGTLEHMERMNIIKQANKSLHMRKNELVNTSADLTASAVFKPNFPMEKENVVNCASPDRSVGVSALSMGGISTSSAGTSEFESIYTDAIRSNKAMDRNSFNLKSKSSSRRMTFETPNTRKMKRQIQRDWIGTIDEGMYSDEEEI